MPETDAKQFLLNLIEEVEATDPNLLPPRNAKDPGDKSVGFVDDEFLKKVFCLAAFYRREGRRMEVDMEAIDEDPHNSSEYCLYHSKYDALNEIQWLLVRQTADYWGPSVGIRKDWEIVAPAKKPSTEVGVINLKKLLDGLL